MKLALQVPTQYSNFVNVIKYIQNKLGNRALKSDLKSTVNPAIFLSFLIKFLHYLKPYLI